MPCVASDHQLYALRPRLAIGTALVFRLPIFSASVIRPTMSSTRTSIGSVASHHGCLAYIDDALAHGLLIIGGVVGFGTGVPLHEKLKTSRRQTPPHFSAFALSLQWMPLAWQSVADATLASARSALPQ